MAWTTTATSNDELVDKLVSLKIIDNFSIEQAFRATDRGIFVGLGDHASLQHVYSDRPFKNHLVHLSAPHMYVTILNALGLKEGQAFLNIGSGSGYLSSLVLCLLGDGGLSHGIDINQELVNQARESCKRWVSDIIRRRRIGEHVPRVSPEGVAFVSGNCFEIDVSTTNTCKYDRIYIGAACPQRFLKYFLSLLSEDGALVAPILERGELVKIQKVIGSVYTTQTISAVFYAPLVHIPHPLGRSFGSGLLVYDIETEVNHDEAEGESDDEEEIPGELQLEGLVPPPNNVRSESATENSSGISLVKLPSVIWYPRATRHRQYPTAFKDTILFLFLANRYSNKNVSLFCRLNYYLLVTVVTFMSRDWFMLTRPPVELLREEVRAERRMRLNAERTLRDLQLTHSHVLRERDVLRNLLLRLRDANSFENEHFADAGEIESDSSAGDTDDDEGSGSQSSSLPMTEYDSGNELSENDMHEDGLLLESEEPSPATTASLAPSFPMPSLSITASPIGNDSEEIQTAPIAEGSAHMESSATEHTNLDSESRK